MVLRCVATDWTLVKIFGAYSDRWAVSVFHVEPMLATNVYQPTNLHGVAKRCCNDLTKALTFNFLVKICQLLTMTYVN